ncbi:uncharacterized protein Z520_01730 [Fonsecaea multimorphosa CBS 102226]|uniref:Uncharacterized protein n=1 Tax=Fonsecaea multimorphosa CBS 102226 TaxID=1442371 RepID=A0A0D2KB62_9EURO|nr:uncharacterized protein Z520_01730 [Fonsecaea multimorphosa CBS 102226]KIY03263.1 hypothetical protein Z520_01730 [Fonsecaea multimorphosa CBS 102226]OAL30182.1 hypothetical protein AYO22_01698 [Fonsecaea multimorphosa]
MSSSFLPDLSNDSKTIGHALPPAFFLPRALPLHSSTIFRKQTAVQHLSETMEELYRSALARLQLELELPDNIAKRLDAKIKQVIVPPFVPDAGTSVLNYGLDFEAVACSVSGCPEFRPYFERTRSRNWESSFNNAIYYWAHAVCGVSEIYKKQRPVTRRSLDTQQSPKTPERLPESMVAGEPSTTPTFSASSTAAVSPGLPNDIFVAPQGSSSQAAGDRWMRLWPGKYDHCIEIRALSGTQEEVLSGRMEELFHVRCPMKTRGYDYVLPHCRRFLEKHRKAPPDAEVKLFYYIKWPNLASPTRVLIEDNKSCERAYDFWSTLEDSKIPFMLFLDDLKYSHSVSTLPPTPQISPRQGLENSQDVSRGMFHLYGGH